MWCNVSIVVFCSRIKRARCYHVLWKWTPYRVTYSSWGQVLTDARSNKTDFFKTILLNEVSKGIFFLDVVVGLMANNDFVCAICHKIEAILETETAGNWFYGFSTQCVPIPAFFFFIWQQETNTWQKNASRGFSLKRNSSQKLLICHIASGTKVTYCIAKYKQ